jgi:chromosome segregation ATPase
MGTLSQEPSTRNNSEKSETSVISLWLGGALIIAVLASAVLSGMLILKMAGFEDSERQAHEAEAALKKARSELSSLQIEVESLEKQREILVPTIVDWEQRRREKAEAEAFLAMLESKRRQTESDTTQAGKRLEDTNKDLVSAGKQKAEISSEIEKLKAERLSLRKANADAQVTLDQATDAERRLNESKNVLTSLNMQRKQLASDIADAQKRRDQIQGEADETRKERERLADEVAKLHRQVQDLKNEKTSIEERVSGLKAIQATVQQEEQKFAKIQEQVSAAEARRDEIEDRLRRMASEEALLRNRLEQIRKEVAEWEPRRDAAKATLQESDSELSAARKLLQETSAKQGELVRDVARLATMVERLKKEKEALETEVTEEELHRDMAKTDWQKADFDLSAARKLLHEMSAKQDDLVRESSHLESTIEQLKLEKEGLERDLGRLEGQQPKSLTGAQ